MSYPRHLDEYGDAEIYAEMTRRWSCKRKHECSYCGGRLDSGHPCKLQEHDAPVPEDYEHEFVMREIATEIDRRLPGRRGFVLVVQRFGTPGVDEAKDALATYVSSIDAKEVPDLLTGMAGYIEERERRRTPKTPD